MVFMGMGEPLDNYNAVLGGDYAIISSSLPNPPSLDEFFCRNLSFSFYHSLTADITHTAIQKGAASARCGFHVQQDSTLRQALYVIQEMHKRHQEQLPHQPFKLGILIPTPSEMASIFSSELLQSLKNAPELSEFIRLEFISKCKDSLQVDGFPTRWEFSNPEVRKGPLANIQKASLIDSMCSFFKVPGRVCSHSSSVVIYAYAIRGGTYS